MAWRELIGWAVVGLVCWAAPPQAPPLASGEPRLTASERASTLAAIEGYFQELYVFPELRPRIVARLREAETDRRYAVEDPRLFAERITQDLRDVAHDEHLSCELSVAMHNAA